MVWIIRVLHSDISIYDGKYGIVVVIRAVKSVSEHGECIVAGVYRPIVERQCRRSGLGRIRSEDDGLFVGVDVNVIDDHLTSVVDTKDASILFVVALVNECPTIDGPVSLNTDDVALGYIFHMEKSGLTRQLNAAPDGMALVKKTEKDSLYSAMDFGSVWLERALSGK